MTTPSLRCRSVTGWPHHLSPQLCRVPASTGRSPKPPRPGAAPGRHGAAHGSYYGGSFSLGMWPTRKAPALQAVSCGSITRHLHHFHWELPRLADCKSAVKKRAGRRRVEHYHQLPPFTHTHAMVPKPKSSRRTVVNRVTNECESRRDRHGNNLPRARGRQLIRAAWDREIPGAAPGQLALRSCGGQLFHWGCGSTRKAPALQAVSCGSVTRHLQCCARQYFSLGVVPASRL